MIPQAAPRGAGRAADAVTLGVPPTRTSRETVLSEIQRRDAPPAGRPGAPRPGVVDLWLLDVSRQTEETLDLSVLDAEERRRVAAFVHGRDRIRYAVAHTALRRVLGACVGRAPEAIELGRDTCPCCGGPHGRPVLADPPFPVHFSLSHGGDLVMIGVASEAIGVDVEPVALRRAVGDLAAVLHPAEQAELAELPADGRPAGFTRVWTRKEAYLKGIGTGLGRDLAADYLGTTGRAALPAGWTVVDVPTIPGHAAACAVQGPPFTVRMRQPPAELQAAGRVSSPGRGRGEDTAGPAV
ncbi:4'-phosphopantetheinyl transferase family protein [Streptomyces liangshanensis]|uniref:4'-phosphopantetheinyl transferase superfamily protein n=1 Tax=Streptomyces liangshanensis TaxID=2717324 RepID=A0A6G9GSH2_9ACTN|nr:4'-phosphopantetheinyl transferase superfamily protein [Streptomyces liangshanensis]QIQ01144.1 4'-phosphopantetheinyl transferase superfamily protein [Streptomyces liangshanensis]